MLAFCIANARLHRPRAVQQHAAAAAATTDPDVTLIAHAREDDGKDDGDDYHTVPKLPVQEQTTGLTQSEDERIRHALVVSIKETNTEHISTERQWTDIPRDTATLLPTGLVYHEACSLHAPIGETHVECGERVSVTFAQLERNGLLENPAVCKRVDARLASDEELLRVHTRGHVACLTASSHDAFSERVFEDPDMRAAHPGWVNNDDVFTNEHSNAAARLTAGGLIDAAIMVMDGKLCNAFVLGRPPGHHAASGAPSGFCLINNITVAIEAVLAVYPSKKIILFDFDIHHGDGSQSFFYHRRDVLVFSVHKYMEGTFFPGSTAAAADQVGADGAEGFNFNVPLNTGNLGDDQYGEIVRTLLLPIVEQFAPDMVFVSAGFDIGMGEVVGTEEGKYDNMLVRANGFALMTSLLLTHMKTTLQHGRLVVSLEGGYNVANVADGVEAMLRVMTSQPQTIRASEPYTWQQEQNMTISRAQFDIDLLEVLNVQAKYWPCFNAALRDRALHAAVHIPERLERAQNVLRKCLKSENAAERDAVKSEEVAMAKRQRAVKFQKATRKADDSVGRWRSLLALSNMVGGSISAEANTAVGSPRVLAVSTSASAAPAPVADGARDAEDAFANLSL